MNRATSENRLAFTITELLVVIGAIALLLAVLFPALAAVRGSAVMTTSSNNMRQIATFMQAYQKDNREVIIPSQFDYSDADVFTNQGKVRSEPVTQGDEHKGTWTDIIWTVFELGSFDGATANPDLGGDYRFDSPDGPLYAFDEDDIKSPLRSVAPNTREVTAGNGIPLPFGTGAKEKGLPGLFAANDFFSAVPGDNPPEIGVAPVIGNWYSGGQIQAPEKSVYLVDSYAGEVIAPEAVPWDNDEVPLGDERTIQVDFRYPDACLMMFLDGHVEPQSRWEDLGELQTQRGLRIQALDQRAP